MYLAKGHNTVPVRIERLTSLSTVRHTNHLATAPLPSKERTILKDGKTKVKNRIRDMINQRSTCDDWDFGARFRCNQNDGRSAGYM